MADNQKSKKNALSHAKLRLKTPCPGAQGKFSELSWDIWNNNPRISVRTNDPGDADKDYGRITAPMDMPTFYVFLDLLKQINEGPVDTKVKIENCAAGPRGEYGKPQEVIHNSDTWIGKDKEGLVYLSVVSKKDSRPVIKFTFGPADNRFHRIFHANGEPYSKAEFVKVYATAYYNLLSKVMANLMISEFVEYQPPAGSSYSKGGGNGGGGYSKPAYKKPEETTTNADLGDDFPF